MKQHKGVEAVIIVNKDGVPIRPSKGMDDQRSKQYASHITELTQKARAVIRDLDPKVIALHSGCVFVSSSKCLHNIQNDLTFLRIRSQKHEIMVAPDRDFTLIVIQNDNASEE